MKYIQKQVLDRFRWIKQKVIYIHQNTQFPSLSKHQQRPLSSLRWTKICILITGALHSGQRLWSEKVYTVDSVYSPAFRAWEMEGNLRRREHKMLLMSAGPDWHTRVQLVLLTQWGPISVCSCSHVHVPVRESQSCVRTLFSPPQGVTHWPISAPLTRTPHGDSVRWLAMLAVR